MNNITLSEYNYHLPDNLIASKPLENRSESKLLHCHSNTFQYKDDHFYNLKKILKKDDLLILNDTRVIPARMNVNKETGGKIEIFFNRIMSDDRLEVIYSSSRPPKKLSKLFYTDDKFFIVIDIYKNYLIIEDSQKHDLINIFLENGLVPLPKYIKRPVTKLDKEKYQTVYAEHDGSVAAPTAGLHFTKDFIQELNTIGVKIKYLTLHISYNTFKPIKDDDYTKHEMGKEFCMIDKSVFDEIEIRKNTDKRIIAVGTTVTRALEYCYSNNINATYSGYVDIFITPGYKFKAINSLLTNFHLPKSSLLLLVSAFAGQNNILNAYAHAVKNQYRFFSYGDSMFLDKLC